MLQKMVSWRQVISASCGKFLSLPRSLSLSLKKGFQRESSCLCHRLSQCQWSSACLVAETGNPAILTLFFLIHQKVVIPCVMPTIAQPTGTNGVTGDSTRSRLFGSKLVPKAQAWGVSSVASIKCHARDRLRRGQGRGNLVAVSPHLPVGRKCARFCIV